MDSQIIDTGYSDQDFKIRNNTYAIDGYEFICWNTKADGSGQNFYPNELKTFQDDITLYALWKFLYKYMELVEVGDVIANSNVATHFNLNSGLRTPNYFDWTTSSSFELVFCIITGDDVSTKQILYRLSSDYKMNLCLYNGKLHIEYNAATSTSTFAPNTKYYIKVIKNGTQIEIYKSIDNISYELALSTAINFSSSTLYFVFGQNYQYTDSRQETYVEKETRYLTTYDTETKWITKNSCAYADKNGRTYTYEQKLQHATYLDKVNKIPNLNKSTSCGYWTTVLTPKITPYEVDVQKSRTIYFTVAVTNFLGQIDFNLSYFILNGIKNKLKVKA